MDVTKGNNELVLPRKETKRLKNKDSIALLIQIATQFGCPAEISFRLKGQLPTSVKMMIPVIPYCGLIETTIRFDLDAWLQSKSPEKIPYIEWLEFITCFFMQPPLGRMHRFVVRYNVPISVLLASFVPVMVMIITILHK